MHTITSSSSFALNNNIDRNNNNNEEDNPEIREISQRYQSCSSEMFKQYKHQKDQLTNLIKKLAECNDETSESMLNELLDISRKLEDDYKKLKQSLDHYYQSVVMSKKM